MKELVPELRFPEFGIEYRKRFLKDLTTKIGDGLHSTPIYDDKGEYYFVNGNNLINAKIKIEDSTKRVSKTEFLKYRKELNNTTVLLSINGTIGNLAYFNNEHVILGKSAAYINVNESLEKRFLYYSLQCERIKKYFLTSVTGSTIKNLGLKAISQTKLNLPSLPEQTKIADFLSKVDEQITLLTKKKEKLEEYKKGVMQKLFSQELRFKDENGNEYPEWEEKKLGDEGKIVNGLTYSPDDINDEGDLVLRSSNIQEGKLCFSDNVYVKVNKFNPVRLNDILICVRNGSKNLIGKNALITKEAEGNAFGAFMTVYRSKSNKFIYQWMQGDLYKKYINRNLGATINSINGSDLKSFKINLPSLPEQTKIANFLSAIDDQITVVEKQLAQSKTFKQGLLQKMFA